MAGVTLDAGALIALDRDDRRVLLLLARTREQRELVTIPATALAQSAHNLRRQMRLARLIRQATTAVVPLDRGDATHVGRLLASTGTSDIADAHVVVCARRTRDVVVTSDPADLGRLDPSLRLFTI